MQQLELYQRHTTQIFILKDTLYPTSKYYSHNAQDTTAVGRMCYWFSLMILSYFNLFVCQKAPITSGKPP
uniref:Uncharacterized protein n=1 Tax=Rhizophora mucronata TaxID=61149 RepID=A0A2P2QP84_RHIMU